MVVPATFEGLEAWVRDRWIRLCVVDAEIKVRGVPMRRQRELVTGNPSLWNVWLATRRQIGQTVTIYADFVWEGGRVGRVDFSVDQTARAVAGEPAVSYLPSGEPASPSDLPPRPSVQYPKPNLWSMLPRRPGPGVFITGLKIVLKGYLAGLELGLEIPRYGGRAYGFADMLGRMAASLPADAERLHAYRPIPPRDPIDAAVRSRAQGNRAWLRGYGEGARDAVQRLRRYETNLTPGEAYASVAYLRMLRHRYGPTQREIREGLIRDHLPIEVDWRRYVTDD